MVPPIATAPHLFFNMSTTEKIARKRDARPRSIVRRGELVTATPPVGLDRAFLVRLRKQDPQLELHWHPLMNLFLLYSRRRGNGQGANDVLVLEMNLGKKHPGNWLIEWLQWADKFAGGAIAPRAARRKYLNGLEEHERARLDEWDRKRMDMSEDVAKHLKWCIDGRCSVVVDWQEGNR